MSAARKPDILVVDDNDGIRLLIRELLEREGFQVRTAADGAVALEEVQRDPPDLVITDIHMPRLSGFQLCRLLKAPERGHGNVIPVMVVSATADAALVEDAVRSAGADAFLGLPFESEEFLRRVHGLLERREGRGMEPETILVVDDEPDITRMLATALRKKDYRVLEAHDGPAALEAVQQHRPRLVILDYMMPGMDGMEVLRRVREFAPETLVIMVTGQGSETLAVEALKSGASDYIPKPFEVREIPTVVQKIIFRDHALRLGRMIERREAVLGQVAQIEAQEDGNLPVEAALDPQREARWLAYTVRRMREGVLITDATGRILYLNAAASGLVGLPADRLLGRDFSTLVAGARPRERAAEVLAYALDGGWDGDLALVRAPREAGTEGASQVAPQSFPAHLSVSPVPGEGGKPAALAFIFRDVTERQRMEEELRSKHEQLVAASRVKSTFLAHMSHELRTPLNAIIGFANVLMEQAYGKLNPKQLDFAKDIFSSGQKLLQLIDGVMLLTKLDAGDAVLRWAPVNLIKMLHDVRTVSQPMLLRRQVELDLQHGEDLPLTWADESFLRQAALHVVERVLEHAAAGDRIVLATRRGRQLPPGIDSVELEISVHGRGSIPPEPADGDVLDIARTIIGRLGGELESCAGGWVIRLATERPASAQ